MISISQYCALHIFTYSNQLILTLNRFYLSTVMDDSVLAKLQSTFLVGGDVHDTHTPHPHYALYKQRREGYGNQETRRKKSLEIQRSRRRDFVDYARRIVEGEVWEESGEGGEMEEGGYDEVDTTEDKEEKMVNCTNRLGYSS